MRNHITYNTAYTTRWASYPSGRHPLIVDEWDHHRAVLLRLWGLG